MSKEGRAGEGRDDGSKGKGGICGGVRSWLGRK